LALTLRLAGKPAQAVEAVAALPQVLAALVAIPACRPVFAVAGVDKDGMAARAIIVVVPLHGRPYM
jgi:hypothetical protein